MGWLVGDARLPGQAVVVPCHQSLRSPPRSPQAALIAVLELPRLLLPILQESDKTGSNHVISIQFV